MTKEVTQAVADGLTLVNWTIPYGLERLCVIHMIQGSVETGKSNIGTGNYFYLITGEHLRKASCVWVWRHVFSDVHFSSYLSQTL